MPIAPRRQIVARLAGALFACGLLSSCGDNSATSTERPPLEGAAIGGEFELVDSMGQTVRAGDFDGEYLMVYFGYAYCPDVCPFDLQRMMQGYRQFAEEHPDLGTKVQPIFITVDPERDTPEVVGEFTANFGDNLVGLTGTPEQIAEAARTFSVYYAKNEESAGAGYLMDHSRAAFLMGPKGEPIALLPVEASGPEVAAELGKWVS